MDWGKLFTTIVIVSVLLWASNHVSIYKRIVS